MTNGLILLILVITFCCSVTSGQLHGPPTPCQSNFTECTAPLHESNATCDTGAFKSALTCGAALLENRVCFRGDDDDVMHLNANMLDLHSACMMGCGTAADCPYDGSKFAAALENVDTISSNSKRCIIDLVNCQSMWNACTLTLGSCTCIEDAIACSHGAAAPCPTLRDVVPAMSKLCKEVGKCTVAQCDSAMTASAPIALVAAISVMFLALN
jgi:hypothetical protein